MDIRDKWNRALPSIKEALVFGSVYFFAAFINLRVKLLVTPTWFDGVLESNHKRLLVFQYSNNEQSRLLQFGIPEALKYLFHLSTVHAYILQRWLFIFLVFLCFHFYLRKWFDAKLAFAGVLFLAAIMPLTYFNDLQESTPLLLLTFLLALWAIREYHTLRYMLYLCIGILNNETVLILPLVFFCYNFKSFKSKPMFQLILNTLMTSLPAFIIFGLIRYQTRHSPRLAPLWQLPDNIHNILDQLRTSPLDYWRATFLYIIFIFGVFWLFAFLKYSQNPIFLQRAAIMIPFFIIAHLLAGMINEVRLMLPLSFIIIPMAFFYLFPNESKRTATEAKIPGG